MSARTALIHEKLLEYVRRSVEKNLGSPMMRIDSISVTESFQRQVLEVRVVIKTARAAKAFTMIKEFPMELLEDVFGDDELELSADSSDWEVLTSNGRRC